MSWRAHVAIGCALAGGVGCQAYDRSLIDELTRTDDAAADDATSDADAAAAPDACTPAAGGDPCSAIPLLTAPPTIDGIDDEFCNVPAAVFTAAEGAAPSTDGTAGVVPPAVAGRATVRVAWTPDGGLYLFAHVDKSPVFPAPASGTDALYLFDAIEIFASGSTALTGRYGPPSYDTGTVHLIVSPAAVQNQNARGASFALDGSKIADLPADTFATRLVDQGFDVELQIGRGLLGVGGTLGIGMQVGFDFGLDLRETDADGGTYRFQSFLAMHVPDGGTLTNTACGSLAPFCDDRLWCTPTLDN